MKTRHWFSALVLVLSLTTLHTPAAAAPDCSQYSAANAMSWPANDPVWEFCWRRLSQSAPQPNGSAVELFNVHYNGHLVFDRLNMPILNVEYGPGGCGCFRDWFDQEIRFEAVGAPCANGYCETIQEPVTVCECAPSDTCDSNPTNACNVDLGDFTGVAADKGASRLIMTSQAAAGWYRYTVKWTFELDGTIRPDIGFSSRPNGCTDTTHFHHGYYRLDFDINGAGNDEVFVESLVGAGIDTDSDGVDDNLDNCLAVANADQRDTDGDDFGNRCDADLNNDQQINFLDLGIMKSVIFTANADADLDGDGNVNFIDLGLMKAAFFGAPGPTGTLPQAQKVMTETGAYSGDAVSWLVSDSQTGRGYRLLPGRLDHSLEVTTFDPVPFAKGDYWVLAQNANEQDDNTFSCAADLDEFVSGESTNDTDVVFWYRIGDLHTGLDECHCGRVGPRLEPVGDWSPVTP